MTLIDGHKVFFRKLYSVARIKFLVEDFEKNYYIINGQTNRCPQEHASRCFRSDEKVGL